MTLNGATFEHYLFKKVAVTDALQGELIGLASTRGSTIDSEDTHFRGRFFSYFMKDVIARNSCDPELVPSRSLNACANLFYKQTKTSMRSRFSVPS